MWKIGKRAALSVFLAMNLLAGLLPQIMAQAEDTEQEHLVFRYPSWDSGGSRIVLEEIDFKEVTGTVSLLEDTDHPEAYREASSGEDTSDAPVSWNGSTLALRNYSCDYRSYSYPDGSRPDEIIFGNTQTTLKIIGECSITYSGGGCIWIDQGGLSIVKGSEDAELALSTSGMSDENDDYSFYTPLGLGGSDAEFTNEVKLSLTSGSKADENAWDMGMEKGSKSFAERIHNTGTIEGVLPQDTEEIYIGTSGLLFDDDQAAAYWKTSGSALIEGTADDYQLHYDVSSRTLSLKDFVFEGKSTVPLVAGCDIHLVLTGENKISYDADTAVIVNGSLDISGSGSLEVVTACAELQDENGDKVIPPAMSVAGSGFHNKSTLICRAHPEAQVDLSLHVPVSMVGNTGKISGRFAADGDDGSYIEGTDMKAPSEDDYAMPTDHKYLGKAYYFTSETMYPNNITGEKRAENEWLIVGKYDEKGNPIPSNIFYQYYYLDDDGAYLTEDFHYPVSYLVYDENPEALLKSKDIAAVSDGKTHTFNADLYAVWFTRGNVTVNGNVFLDVACFEQAMTEEGDATRTQYIRDESGNIKFMDDSKGAAITINGNTGFLSLNDSYDGSVTINGDVRGCSKYDDVNVKDGEKPIETYYNAIVNAGKIMEDGKLLKDFQTLQGYKGQAVYEDVFYMKTERVLEGEAMRGTAAAVNGDALLVDVSAKAIGDNTYPLVRESDKAEYEKIKSLLSNKDTKLSAMDISLIRGNKTEVQPDGAVSLYIGNLTEYKNPALYHIKSDGTIEMLEPTKTADGSYKIITSGFSTYFVAEKQTLLSSNINNMPSNGAEGAGAAVGEVQPPQGTASTAAATVTAPNTGDDLTHIYFLLFTAAIAVTSVYAGRIKKVRR